jgi:outer membrane lipoprotein
MFRYLFLGSLAILLTACSSDPIREADVSKVTILQAREKPLEVRGQRVRWGGTILSADNRRDDTVLEVLGRPLRAMAEPDDRQTSLGRFQVRLAGFVDPAEYHEPNRITVVGMLEGVRQGKVGDYKYTYPLLIAEQHKLWKGNYQVNEPVYLPSWGYPYYYRHSWPYWWSDRYFYDYPHRYPRHPRRADKRDNQTKIIEGRP